jgi:uncharacterized protein (TIGR03067 family)
MKTKLTAVLLLCGAWCVAATGQGGDAKGAKEELDKLQGTWKLVSEVDSGQTQQVDPMETFTFNKDTCQNKVGSKLTDEFTIKIDPGKTPKEMDMIPLKDPSKGIPCPAIYKIEGNQLVICVNFSPNGKRPSGFDSNANNRNIILKMDKMEKK